MASAAGQDGVAVQRLEFAGRREVQLRMVVPSGEFAIGAELRDDRAVGVAEIRERKGQNAIFVDRRFGRPAAAAFAMPRRLRTIGVKNLNAVCAVGGDDDRALHRVAVRGPFAFVGAGPVLAGVHLERAAAIGKVFSGRGCGGEQRGGGHDGCDECLH